MLEVQLCYASYFLGLSLLLVDQSLISAFTDVLLARGCSFTRLSAGFLFCVFCLLV